MARLFLGTVSLFPNDSAFAVFDFRERQQLAAIVAIPSADYFQFISHFERKQIDFGRWNDQSDHLVV